MSCGKLEVRDESGENASGEFISVSIEFCMEPRVLADASEIKELIIWVNQKYPDWLKKVIEEL